MRFINIYKDINTLYQYYTDEVFFMYCKVCGKHLFENLDLRVLFKLKYNVHIDCEVFLNDIWIESVFPIENNEILFNYLDTSLNSTKDLCIDYIYDLNLKYIYQKIVDNHMWSIVIFYDEEVFSKLTDIELELLLKLSRNPFVFISKFAY